MNAASATTKATDMATVSKEQIVEFQAKLKQTNDLMRVIYKIYSELKTQDTEEYMKLKKKMKPFKKAIRRFVGGPIRELHWLFFGVRCSDWFVKFLDHLDALEKLTPEEMLAGITKQNAPGCFRENSRQIGQYFEKYSHLAPNKNPLHPSIAALCSTAHSVGRLHQICRNDKIDDSATRLLRQGLETRILAKLSWWMSATGKPGKEKMSWVAYLEANQLTKMNPDAQAEIADMIEVWLIAMRAIEDSYVLLRKNAALKKRVPRDVALIGWENTVNDGPGLKVVVNRDTCARWLNWSNAARGEVDYLPVSGKPSDYGMPSWVKTEQVRLDMD